MKRILFVALLITFLVITSCQKAEEVTISKYFQAMNVGEKGDLDTMSAMAITPKLIKYKSYEIVSISEPVDTNIELPGMMKKLADLDKKMNEIKLKFSDINDEIQDIEDLLVDARGSRKKNELKNQINEKKKEKDGILAEFKTVVSQKKELEKQIEVTGNVMKASVSRPNMKNLEMFEGKCRTVKAELKITLLNMEVKNYVFVLKKYLLTLSGKKLKRSRYLITDIMTLEEYNSRKNTVPGTDEGVTEEVSEPKTKTEGN